MKLTWLLPFLFLVSCGGSSSPGWSLAAASPKHPFGYYGGQVEARWESDGRNMTLTRDLRYTDPDGVVWVAPAGSVVDGASIPRTLWSLMGGPFEGKYRNASVLHDVAYEQHTRSWKECDRMFYNAMRCSGVGASEAKTMYYALYRHGNHWRPPKIFAGAKARSEENVLRAEPVNEQELAVTKNWIENANPSLAQIEARADNSPR